jgi:hypothetical protein
MTRLMLGPPPEVVKSPRPGYICHLCDETVHTELWPARAKRAVAGDVDYVEEEAPPCGGWLQHLDLIAEAPDQNW